MRDHEDYGTIWVCTCCMLTYANGECCDPFESLHDEVEHPWSRLPQSDGWAYSPENWEPDTYSTSQCEGCGSYLHGERHAFYLWKRK